MMDGMYPELSEREQRLLRYTIHNYVQDASPVSSKKLVREYRLSISSATVRNILSTLEEKGFLYQPHTSAGRMPTELGYRYFVNTLMQVEPLSNNEMVALEQIKKALKGDLDNTLFQAAQLLARLSNMLALVVSPKLANGIFRKLDLISVSETCLLVIITIESGLSKTVNIEVEHRLNRHQLDDVARILNERLCGYPIVEITEKLDVMLADKQSEDETGLIKIFINSADTIFNQPSLNKFYYGGVEYMALLPEFRERSRYKKIVKMLENDQLVIHLLDQMNLQNDVSVRIGSENKIDYVDQCSVVSAHYNIGNISGKVGLLGPTRMNYGKMISLIDQLVSD